MGSQNTPYYLQEDAAFNTLSQSPIFSKVSQLTERVFNFVRYFRHPQFFA